MGRRQQSIMAISDSVADTWVTPPTRKQLARMQCDDAKEENLRFAREVQAAWNDFLADHPTPSAQALEQWCVDNRNKVGAGVGPALQEQLDELLDRQANRKIAEH